LKAEIKRNQPNEIRTQFQDYQFIQNFEKKIAGTTFSTRLIEKISVLAQDICFIASFLQKIRKRFILYLTIYVYKIIAIFELSREKNKNLSDIF
jgi:hypothetical protein